MGAGGREAGAVGQPAAADADLDELATSEYLAGHEREAARLREQLHARLQERGDLVGAARNAAWLALDLLLRGEPARSGGWLGRASSLLAQSTRDCPEQGYVLVVRALQAAGSGDLPAANRAYEAVEALGVRFRDADLQALGLLGRGEVLIAALRAQEGTALLDEAMVAVTAGEVSPFVSGLVYCAVVGACHDAFDLPRARQWTRALDDWCAGRPDLVAFRGQCLVHRAEILELDGDWPSALVDAGRARVRLSDPPGQPALGAACYVEGEIHRLCGRHAAALKCYREASRRGRSPQPGWALVRLAQGRVEVAATSIRGALAEAVDPVARFRLLPAWVDVALAAGDVAGARAAADELVAMAESLGSDLVRARAAHAVGAVLLAEADAAASLSWAHRAADAWRALAVPFEEARSRELAGCACTALGDADAAALERDAARALFRGLGAQPDAERLTTERPAPLSEREHQVLRLVAAGRTNRAVAAELVISERTVAHHVGHILRKLGLPSRAAATAYAYEHGLVGPDR
ncbi:LuxR C-terminal-related transcriptional regulator [Cellulomonas sp. Leaf334]|uniref:LuxR C-terminal-related transcriptional regulator n=1 Tax=Cellulomonas sp. Leaf334 TaxID=1736339 RepID=UPI0006F529A9|nr:LuxR C-terminal-related transcriptional regulator [Cellulomonas sp. Leaf334]KQR16480.1 hypothetical protein ASF78_03635 [Cellulomonas sp. Leaf334]